uniref:Uncharacterized protein n=1 Tax=Rhizophora mucronata TaxID=61149 RepID=A0A2P2NH57_RHIMU
MKLKFATLEVFFFVLYWKTNNMQN